MVDGKRSGFVCRSLVTLTAGALALLVAVRPAGAQQNDAAEAPPPAVTPEEFAIFPWDQLKPTRESYEEARECGFNLAGFVTPENLDRVQQAGMRGFVADSSVKLRGVTESSDEEIATRVKEVVGRSGKHPAAFGFHILDEPPRSQVPLVARWARAFGEAAQDKVAFVNLLPIHGPKGADASAAYEDYLTTYVEGAKPKAFSFDQYSLMDDGSVRPNLFTGFEVVRRVSQKTGVPFWFVALANSHFHYAEPSPATLRFQVFTALAYGAKGMGWFTYTGRDRGNYRLAAIDLNGRRTPTWEMLRDANLIIHRLAPVYTKLKSVNAFHHPGAAVPPGCKPIGESRFVSDVKGTGPFLVGEFEDEQGRPALVVVNRDLKRSTTVEVVTKEKGTLLRVSAYTGTVRPWAAEDNWLAPGQGMLLILDKPAAAAAPKS